MTMDAAVAALITFNGDPEAIEPQGWHRTTWGVSPGMTFRRRVKGDPGTEHETGNEDY